MTLSIEQLQSSHLFDISMQHPRAGDVRNANSEDFHSFLLASPQ
jgi:hypothetical protein